MMVLQNKFGDISPLDIIKNKYPSSHVLSPVFKGHDMETTGKGQGLNFEGFADGRMTFNLAVDSVFQYRIQHVERRRRHTLRPPARSE
jgi:hypothetical protein